MAKILQSDGLCLGRPEANTNLTSTAVNPCCIQPGRTEPGDCDGRVLNTGLHSCGVSMMLHLRVSILVTSAAAYQQLRAETLQVGGPWPSKRH